MLTAAQAYGNRADYQRAIADASRAIELDPKCTDAYANRGRAFLATGRLDSAVRDCTRAIELDSKCAKALASRGEAYDALGQLDNALQDYTRVIELSVPGGGRSEFHLRVGGDPIWKGRVPNGHFGLRRGNSS